MRPQFAEVTSPRTNATAAHSHSPEHVLSPAPLGVQASCSPHEYAADGLRHFVCPVTGCISPGNARQHAWTWRHAFLGQHSPVVSMRMLKPCHHDVYCLGMGVPAAESSPRGQCGTSPRSHECLRDQVPKPAIFQVSGSTYSLQGNFYLKRWFSASCDIASSAQLSSLVFVASPE